MRLWLLPILLLASAAAAQEEEEYVDEVVDLYSEDSPVTHMDLNNFKTLLFGKRHAWVVEFYNPWCGKCQRFAPIWLRTAQEVASKY